MYRLMVVIALLFGVTADPVAASEKDDVIATVHKFIEGLNTGDTKSAFAACASPAFVVDEVPPYSWQGPTACADWAAAYDSDMKKNGVTDPLVKLGKPRHVLIDGDRAYAVLPASYTYKLKGKAKSEKGATLTAALQRASSGWLIAAWTWSKP